MELFELIEEIENTKSDIQYFSDEKERLEIRAGIKATDYSKERTTGGSSNSREDTLLKLSQMSMDLDDATKKLDNLSKLADRKYNVFRNSNDYEKQIYIEKKLKKWSNAKISAKHNGISKSSIYRIIEKFEKKLNIGKKWESR